MPLQQVPDAAELAIWLDTIADNDRTTFLLSVRDHLRSGRALTERQAVVVRRIRDERAGGTPAQGTAVREATVDDLPGILNGVYTINDGEEHLTYRIHTVQRGSLQGKRIIKRQTVYGEFEGFGFLATDGTLRVWRRFQEHAAREERYIVWARYLLQALSSNNYWANNSLQFAVQESINLTAREANEVSPEPPYTTFEIQRSSTCRACNRALTTPSSIDAGLGPECAGRAAGRTAAAAPHETIGTINAENIFVGEQNLGAGTISFEVVADSDEYERAADRINSIRRAPVPPATTHGPLSVRPDNPRNGDVFVQTDHQSGQPHYFLANNGQWDHIDGFVTDMSDAARRAGQSLREFSNRINEIRPAFERATARVAASRAQVRSNVRMSEITPDWEQ